MSIKTKVFIFLLGLITISIVITAYLGINSLIITHKSAEQTISSSLSSQAKKFLLQFTTLAAEENDILFENVRRDASNVAAYAANIFDNAEIFLRGAYWKFDDHIFRGEKGQYLNGKDDVSSLFIPNHVTIDDDLKERVELGAYLDYIFPKVLENNPNAVAIWMVGPEHESRYYPNIGLGNIAPPDQNVLEDVFFAVANPKNNPERKVAWTPVYDDPAAKGLMITASAPIYIKKGFFGVVGIDVTLNTIIKNIKEYNPIEQSYCFLIDKDGYAIVLSEQAYKDILGRKPKESRVDLNHITNEFSRVLDEMKKGSTGFKNISVDGKKLYVAYAPLKGTGFSLGIVVEEEVLFKAIKTMQKEMQKSTQKVIYSRILPIGMLILCVALTLGFLLTRRTLEPIKKLISTAKEISKGNLNKKIEVKSKDEIGELASAFNQMTEDLQKITVSRDELTKEIIERKRAEEEYRMILSTTIDGFWITDIQGRFLDVNDAYCRLIGYSRDELLKMRIADVEAAERPEETAQHIQKIITTDGDRFETRHRCKDGKIVDIEISVNYTKEEGGRLFVFLRDITERKKVEEEQRRLVKDLEEMNKIMTGRELRMFELKKEVNKLSQELGRPKPYETSE